MKIKIYNTLENSVAMDPLSFLILSSRGFKGKFPIFVFMSEFKIYKRASVGQDQWKALNKSVGRILKISRKWGWFCGKVIQKQHGNGLIGGLWKDGL